MQPENAADVETTNSLGPLERKTFQKSVSEISEECDELLVDKQRDYGPKNILKFGAFGCLVRASDKLERWHHLTDQEGEPTVDDETLEDTIKDLRNYAQIALMVMREQFDLPLEEDLE